MSARLLSFGRNVDALRAFFTVAGGSTATNEALLAAAGSRFARASLIRAEQLQALATERDLVLGRLEVCRSLDRVERGLTELQEFEEAREGVAVVNPAGLSLSVMTSSPLRSHSRQPVFHTPKPPASITRRSWPGSGCPWS